MEKLTLALDKYLSTSEYNGTVLISKEDKIVLAKGYGYANFEHKVENSTDTVFRIASITKQFTAFGALKLVEMGLVKLDQTIDKYFPEYKEAARVTIHHLMSNSSGIPNFELDMDFYEIFKSDDYLMGLIRLAFDKDLFFEPGTAFYYSVSGFLMLQKIIEIESGLDFETFMQKNVFSPIGMNSSGFESPGKVISNWAYGYQLLGNKIEVAPYVDMRIAGGGGGMYSTAFDLHLWNQALMNHTVMPKELTMKMFGEYVRADEENCYGYGIFTERGHYYGKDRYRYYHTGGGPGVRSLNMIYPEEKIEIIILSNLGDKETFINVMEGLQEILFN